MRQAKEEPSCSSDQAIDLISAVKELHRFTFQELNKLLRDSENFILLHRTEKGSYMQIDMEKLARFLPLHLVAVLISSARDAALFKYLLCGFRLLCNLFSLAPRQPKLEQILLDDVKVSEQLFDLVLYLLIVLGGYRQENHVSSVIPLLHSALVSCSLHLLMECISAQWQDLVHVLLAHPKVDIFMDAAFGAVCIDVRFLQMKMSASHADFCKAPWNNFGHIINSLCQQCEFSMHFLHSLCQQKSFRERLIKNEELCRKGGVLVLALSILKLDVTRSIKESPADVAAVSRLKSKVISMLLHLCEAENISFLDEVSSSPGGLDLAKSVALEVFGLLKTSLVRNSRCIGSGSNRSYPMGLMQLNAMRLADILSDDSNFRSFVTIYFTEFLTAIFLLPHGEFLSSWCSSDPSLIEEDATLEFDPFAAAGWVLAATSSSEVQNPTNLESTYTPNNMSQANYAHQRTSLLVKVIANLHCFVPDICEEQERNHFLQTFIGFLQWEPTKSSPGVPFISEAQEPSTVCKNMRSLLGHAESLIPNFLNEQDVQLLRLFFRQIQSKSYFQKTCSRSIPAEDEANRAQEVESTGGCSSPMRRKVTADHNNRSGNLKEELSENSSFHAEGFYVRREQMDQPGEGQRQDERNDKGESNPAVSKGFTEIDRDVPIVETSGSDSSSTRVKNCFSPVDKKEYSKSSEYVRESGFYGIHNDEKNEMALSEEKQRRKRKRTIMNAEQMAVIERVLLSEPDMQRNIASVQLWADKLSDHGSEVTCAQLRNWLNNRKARLARMAAKDIRAPEGENANPRRQAGLGGGLFCDSPESPGDELYVPPTVTGGNHQGTIGESTLRAETSKNAEIRHSEFADSASAEFVQSDQGQYAMHLEKQGEVGKGSGAVGAR